MIARINSSNGGFSATGASGPAEASVSTPAGFLDPLDSAPDRSLNKPIETAGYRYPMRYMSNPVGADP